MGDNLVGIISQHINVPPVAPSWHNPGVPQALETLILKLLSKAPEDRPENAAAVAKELAAIGASASALAERVAPQDGKSLARLAGGVFVGREQELHELRAALNDAVSGQGRLVMLVGEPGSGKTRLVDQLATYARMRDANFLAGRCYEGEGAPVFWPWVQIVRAYVKDRDAARIQAAMGPGAADIAHLVSDVKERLPELPAPPPLEPEQARFRLFDSMTTFLVNAARPRTTVLVLDDLHWADKPSLMLLQFLARELKGARLLVIGTYRDTELGRQHHLAQTLAELARHGLSKRILLGGLTAQHVARYIELTAGMAPSQSLAAAVHRETEGNPFFMTEVVKLLVEEGRLEHPGIVTIPLPQGVREVVGRRLNHLPDACNRALTVAAVVGREFRLEVLERVSDLTGDALVAAMDEAVAARVIAEFPGAAGHYSFAHALIRETLYEELSTTRRVRLHRRIGEVLEELYAKQIESRLPELAHHFLEAAAGGDLERAIQYSARAASRATSLLAYEEAAGHYEKALGALDLKNEPDELCRCDLLLGLADAQTKAGNAAKGWETFQEAAQIARRLANAGQFARAALGSGSWAMGVRYGKVDEVQVGLLEEALVMLGDADSPLRARVLAHLALACYHSPGERRLGLSQDAVEMARRTGDAAAQLAALFSRSISLEGYEKAHERLEVATQIVAIAEQTGNKEMVLRGHYRRLRELMEFGDLAAVDREIEIYGRLADELRQPIYLWLKPFCRASRAMLQGHFADCERLLEEALAIGQKAQDQNAALFFGTKMSTLRRLQGRFAELEPRIRSFVEKYPSIVGWRVTLAQICAELGRPDEVRAQFESLAANDFADLPRDGAWVVGICLLAQVCAYLHDHRRAIPLYRLLLPFAGRNIVIGSAAAVYGPVSRHLGLLAATMSRWEEAARHFEDALALSARMGARPFTAYAQHEYGVMLLARGLAEDRERANRLLDQAAAEASDLGMQKILDDIAALRGNPVHSNQTNVSGA
jgi:tetratricopeptide (TPR) repeat protein